MPQILGDHHGRHWHTQARLHCERKYTKETVGKSQQRFCISHDEAEV